MLSKKFGFGLLLGLLVACSKGGDAAHDHDHDHDHDHEHGDHDHDHDHGEGGHVHTAPHGGELLILAEETAHLELVLDRDTGTLDVYSLGAHADTPVRLEQPTLRLALGEAGENAEYEIELAAVASTLTGDTVGDASRFSVTDPRLASQETLAGRVLEVHSLGQTFQDLDFTLNAGTAE